MVIESQIHGDKIERLTQWNFNIVITYTERIRKFLWQSVPVLNHKENTIQIKLTIISVLVPLLKVFASSDENQLSK